MRGYVLLSACRRCGLEVKRIESPADEEQHVPILPVHSPKLPLIEPGGDNDDSCQYPGGSDLSFAFCGTSPHAQNCCCAVLVGS
eukprot:6415041-Amphidinium_carterae.1